jgi:predicted nucleic acid-binding protein
MPGTVVLDSGPVVAFFDKDDSNHALARDYLKSNTAGLVSTLAVVTEAMYLLKFNRQNQQNFLSWIDKGTLRIIDLVGEDWPKIIELHKKYFDLPIDFADATLVAIADRLKLDTVITIDTDFRVYRYRGRRHFKLPLLDGR